MPSQSTLVRKTKQEVLEDFQKLKEEYEELKTASKLVYKPENQSMLAKVKEETGAKVIQAISELESSVSGELTKFSNNLSNILDNLSDKLADEVDKFQEVQQAIKISEQGLRLNRNIEVAADTLENLVEEYERKKKSFISETERLKEEMETQTAVKKRDWEREQEEHAYDLKLERRKENDSYEEEKAAREKILAAKEDEVQQRDEEFKKLTAEAADFPKRLEKELLVKEKEVATRLNGDFEGRVALMKKDWEAEKRFYELQMENLQQQIKKQDAEMGALKKETEAAGKKAQELAVKVIERGRDAGGRAAEESV